MSYRIRNWSKYNAGLKRRGSMTFWLDSEVHFTLKLIHATTPNQTVIARNGLLAVISIQENKSQFSLLPHALPLVEPEINQLPDIQQQYDESQCQFAALMIAFHNPPILDWACCLTRQCRMFETRYWSTL